MNKSNKQCIAKFLKYICDELQIEMDFKLKLTMNRDSDLKTYAYYNPDTYHIKVYCKGRGIADVLRSIAHELVHHLQNKNGELNQEIQDVGGKIEDDANRIAGQFVKSFGYENPELLIYQTVI